MAIDAGLIGRIGLAPGERILWQGQPGRGLQFGWLDLPITIFMLFWISVPVQILFGGQPLQPADFIGVMFLVVGSYMLFGRFLIDAYIRAQTDYVLTNQRAIIVRRGPFPQMRSIFLRNIPDARLNENASGRGSIRFAMNSFSFWNRGRGLQATGMPGGDPGFILIPDAARVYNLLTQAQGAALRRD